MKVKSIFLIILVLILIFPIINAKGSINIGEDPVGNDPAVNDAIGFACGLKGYDRNNIVNFTCSMGCNLESYYLESYLKINKGNDEFYNVLLVNVSDYRASKFRIETPVGTMALMQFGLEFCGNNEFDDGEECDNGDENNNSAECLISCKLAVCGDNFIYSFPSPAHESCDNGTLNGNIEESCSLETMYPGQLCNYCNHACQEEEYTAICGDGFKNLLEECDDGNDDDDCICLSDCTLPTCDDGIICGSEECDNGDLNGEECTPAYNNNCDYCDNSCNSVTSIGGFCGDNIVQNANESCESESDCESFESCNSCHCVGDSCILESVTITPDISPSAPYDSVTITGEFSGDCRDANTIQVDANSSDNSCHLEYDITIPNVDMSGVTDVDISTVTNYPQFIGSWEVPNIPPDCAGKTVHPVAAALWNGTPGSAPENWIAGTDSVYGEVEFASSPPPIGSISSCEELQAMNDDLGGDYYLTQDIDCSDTVNWNGGLGFDPIGDYYTSFDGTFNGNYFSINNIYINRATVTDVGVGLFAHTENAEISNVNLRNVDIIGHWSVGGLIGHMDGGYVFNSSTTGQLTCDANSGGGLIGGMLLQSYVFNSYSTVNVMGNQFVGGLVGASHGEISDSYSTGIVTGEGSYVGGLIGLNNGSSISDSYSTGIVTGGEFFVGGFAGSNRGEIFDSFSSGDVFGNISVGGLVGDNWGEIFDSFSSGDVSGSANVGGLVGYNGADGGISDSSSSSSMHNIYATDVGGLVGYNFGSIDYSFASNNVFGKYNIGGLVGSNAAGGRIFSCFALGNVKATRNMAGGLVAANSGEISSCFALGDVNWYNQGGSYVGYFFGGLVGKNMGTGDIYHSYSTGDVSGDSYVGGFVGVSSGGISNSYWNTETSNQSTSAGGEGRITAEMTYEFVSNTYLGWDFDNIWKDDGINGHYPCLQWQDGNCHGASIEPCVLESVSITSDNPVEQGDSVTISGSFSGDCSAAHTIQVDASGSGCDVQFSGGDISGFTGLDVDLGSGSFSDLWTLVPSIPSECQEVTVEATHARLWSDVPSSSVDVSGLAVSVSGEVEFANVADCVAFNTQHYEYDEFPYGLPSFEFDYADTSSCTSAGCSCKNVNVCDFECEGIDPIDGHCGGGQSCGGGEFLGNCSGDESGPCGSETTHSYCFCGGENECTGQVENNPLCRQDNEPFCYNTHVTATRDNLGDCISESCVEDTWNLQCIPGSCDAICRFSNDCNTAYYCNWNIHSVEDVCQCKPTGAYPGSGANCCIDSNCGGGFACDDCYCIDMGQVGPNHIYVPCYDSSCSGGPGGCFNEGTKVLTPNGRVNIEAIKVGDIVYSYSNGELVEDIVVKLLTHKDYKDPAGILKLGNGVELGVTLNHAFYSPKLKDFKQLMEFSFAEELLYYDEIEDDFVNVNILGFERTDYFPIEYNLHLEKYHNYLVEGIVVHNAHKNPGGGST